MHVTCQSNSINTNFTFESIGKEAEHSGFIFSHVREELCRVIKKGKHGIATQSILCIKGWFTIHLRFALCSKGPFFMTILGDKRKPCVFQGLCSGVRARMVVINDVRMKLLDVGCK